MKVLKNIFLWFIILCPSTNLFAQAQNDKQKGITPMHEFLKANMDSTIIYQYNSSWLHTPEYFMLSKKGDTLTAFKYQSLSGYDKKIILPKMIQLKLNKRIVTDIFSVPVDINQYFNPVYVVPDSLKQFWDNLKNLDPWQIKDDTMDGTGCPIEKGKDPTEIYDGGGITLFLITRNEIKKISFYAPDFFEKECPGRKGRIAILKIRKYFLSHFQHVKL